MSLAQGMCGGVAEATAVGGDKVRHVDKACEGGDDVCGHVCLAEDAAGDVQATAEEPAVRRCAVALTEAALEGGDGVTAYRCKLLDGGIIGYAA